MKSCKNCIYQERNWGDTPCRTCMESGDYDNWTGIDDEESEAEGVQDDRANY